MGRSGTIMLRELVLETKKRVDFNGHKNLNNQSQLCAALIEKLISMFLRSVEITDSCWIWKASKDKDGYGKCTLIPLEWKAYRASYRLFKGDIPPMTCVCHSCDVPSCVNPGHLFLGTHSENIMDKVKKWRTASGDSHGSKTHPEVIKRGSFHHKAVIDEETALKIFNLHDGKMGTGTRLANQFGVSKQLVSRIHKRKGWKHIHATAFHKSA